VKYILLYFQTSSILDWFIWVGHLDWIGLMVWISGLEHGRIGRIVSKKYDIMAQLLK